MKKITLYILTFLLLFCFYCTPTYAKTTSYSVLQGKTIKIANNKIVFTEGKYSGTINTTLNVLKR